MKNVKSIFILTCLISGLTILHFSCKKDKPKPPLDIYIGSFQVGMGQTNYPLKFAINADGTLTAYNNPVDLAIATGSGTYILNNNTFNADVSYPNEPGIHYLFTADCTVNGGVIVQFLGAWGTAPSNNNGGSWKMLKQQSL